MHASRKYRPFTEFGKNLQLFGGRDRDYLVRSEKRASYGADGPTGEISRVQRDRAPRAGVFYIIITLILLVALFPVGLFFLWARKLRWSIGAKLFVTVLTAVLFFFFMTFLINLDTKNATIQKVQDTMRVGLEWVNDRTGGFVDTAADACVEKFTGVKDIALELWDNIDEDVARGLQKVYEHTDTMNESALNIARLVVNAAEEYAGYEGYVPKEKPVTVVDDIVKVTVVPTAEPTLSATIAPTATPTPTPTPAPTATPIALPQVKNAMYARVFFTDGGTYYHAVNNCSGMMNAVEHTLSEASEAGKKCCETCGVSALSMLDSEFYLWADDKKQVHTTDECELFSGAYTLIPFEEAYRENYSFCTECAAILCKAYIEQNANLFIEQPEQLDDSTLRLYEYEKTITVYYGANSRNYHANAECQHMTKAEYVHTLYDALHVDKKGRCNYCSPMTEEDIVDKGEYLTLDLTTATAK